MGTVIHGNSQLTWISLPGDCNSCVPESTCVLGTVIHGVYLRVKLTRSIKPNLICDEQTPFFGSQSHYLIPLMINGSIIVLRAF